MIRDALDNPVPAASGAGRPHTPGEYRVLVVFLVVAKEPHEDGTPHFHTVVKLPHKMRFKQAKRTLIECHQIPSHWSCSHTQVWSALRYIYIATPTKPIVDTELWVWTHDGYKQGTSNELLSTDCHNTCRVERVALFDSGFASLVRPEKCCHSI